MAFQVIARPVPLSLMRRISFWPLVGVPLGAAMVKAWAIAVTVYISLSSPVGVTVAASATVPTLWVTRLLVKVSVVALPTRVSVEVGKVIVPVLDMLEITGVVRGRLATWAPVRVC